MAILKKRRGGVHQRVAALVNEAIAAIGVDVFLAVAKEMEPYTTPLAEARRQFAMDMDGVVSDVLSHKAYIMTNVGVQYAIWNRKVDIINEYRHQVFDDRRAQFAAEEAAAEDDYSDMML
jgi:hypothetical protein